MVGTFLSKPPQLVNDSGTIWQVWHISWHLPLPGLPKVLYMVFPNSAWKDHVIFLILHENRFSAYWLLSSSSNRLAPRQRLGKTTSISRALSLPASPLLRPSGMQIHPRYLSDSGLRSFFSLLVEAAGPVCIPHSVAIFLLVLSLVCWFRPLCT